MAHSSAGQTNDRLEENNRAFEFFGGDTYAAISAWVKISSYQNYLAFAQFNLDNNNRLRLAVGGPSYGTSDDLAVYVGNGTTYGLYTNGGTTLQLNQWHHVFFWFPGNTGQALYIDGADQSFATNGTSPTTIFTPDSTTDFIVGNHDGEIAELAFWFGGWPGGGTTEVAADVALLAKGYSPALFPQNLAVYMPLKDNSWEDRMGNVSVTEAGTNTVTQHPMILTSRVNAVPETQANHVRQTTGKFISHADLGSPAAGDMMRLRVLRDYDASANTDDLQLHHIALWQKNADTE